MVDSQWSPCLIQLPYIVLVNLGFYLRKDQDTHFLNATQNLYTNPMFIHVLESDLAAQEAASMEPLNVMDIAQEACIFISLLHRNKQSISKFNISFFSWESISKDQRKSYNSWRMWMVMRMIVNRSFWVKDKIIFHSLINFTGTATTAALLS